MATIQQMPVRQDYRDSEQHFFDARTEHELIEDDLLASRTVCGVLIAIVVGGLILGVMAVLLSI